MRARLGLVLVCCLTAGLSHGASGADEFADKRPANWHQWRGPDANGVAPLGDPPTNWDEKTNVKWKVPIPGRGVSSPVIWDDRIFLMTAIKTDRQIELPPVTEPQPPVNEANATTRPSDRDGRGNRGAARNRPTNFHQFVVLCLDRNTGRTIWEKIACEVVPHEAHHKTASFANASPITDGRFVYCSFGSRGLYCYDIDGNLQWNRDLGQMQIKFGFGEGSTPALHGDTLIVKCDQEKGSYLTALESRTGEPKWKVLRDEPTTWNTPLIAEYNGRTQVIVTGARRTQSYDLHSGKVIWEHSAKAGVDAIPSPIRLGDLAVLITGLSNKPVYAVPLSATGMLSDDGLAWKHARGTPQIASGVLVGERLFFTKDRAATVSCINAKTGEVIIDQARLDGPEEMYASPVAAAGRVYFTGRNGATAVIDATANQLKVLAENHLDEAVDSSPAIVGKELFIRGEKSLYCISSDN